MINEDANNPDVRKFAFRPIKKLLFQKATEVFTIKFGYDKTKAFQLSQ